MNGGQIENIARKQIVNAILFPEESRDLNKIRQACDSEYLNKKQTRPSAFADAAGFYSLDKIFLIKTCIPLVRGSGEIHVARVGRTNIEPRLYCSNVHLWHKSPPREVVHARLLW